MIYTAMFDEVDEGAAMYPDASPYPAARSRLLLGRYLAHRRAVRALSGGALAAALAACGHAPSTGSGPGPGPDSSVDPDSGLPHLIDAAAGSLDAETSTVVVVAVIGDYGVCSPNAPPQYSVSCGHEKGVAALVHGWQPAAIVTTGDNTYGSGRADQIPGDQAPYDADIAAGNFFPAMGNHDWQNGSIQAALAYFKLSSPYYSERRGALVTFHIVDTNANDPGGDTASSTQARWLDAQLAASTTPWNIVVNHQAPYSSCGEFSYDGTGGRPDYRWIAAAKTDLVLSGHSHVYERLSEPPFSGIGEIPYVVIGASGAPLQASCSHVLQGQKKAVYGVFGALKLEITTTRLTLTFFAENGGVQDTLTLSK